MPMLCATCGIATMWRPIVRGAAMTHPPPDAPILKQCACGRSYDADRWQELPLVGIVGDAKYGRESVFEIRQCACQSSIAIKKTRSAT